MKYNRIPADNLKKQAKALRKIFGYTGEGVVVRSPFQCDCGYNISVGDNSFFNFNCCILDAAKVTVGKNVLLAPNVAIYTVAHPVDATLRMEGYLTAAPVTIKDNVWIGGNVVILAGVTIGQNSVIGAGSVVTKDIPANVIACGNPCRVLRKITKDEKLRYQLP